MPGPTPKDPALRQRRNKPTTAANLPSAADSADNPVPELPKREVGEWHPMVVEWWEGVWRSPMASEYLDADMRGGLYLLADLHQLRWTADSSSALINAAKEIRLQEVRFGLSPIDRRRLQWVIDQGEQAAEKTEARRSRRGKAKPGDDPRGVLKVVS